MKRLFQREKQVQFTKASPDYRAVKLLPLEQRPDAAEGPEGRVLLAHLQRGPRWDCVFQDVRTI